MGSRIISVAALLAGATMATATFAADMTGAGATFPYPIYAKWADAYKKATGNGLNYQSIGSGGGIKQIRSKTVDFGASDKPLKAEDLEKDGMIQFPAIMGGVVPVVKVPGVAPGQLKLSGPLLADIFLGKVKKWNDPAIADMNPGVALPASAITVVHRSDGSGTTFLFTNYLSKVSGEWKSKVGENTSVSWPAGIGGKGNEGVAAQVQRLKGSIGYVEYAYAKQNKMAYALLKNRAGSFVEPSEKTFQAAAANADWKHAAGFYEILTDEPGAESWPITGASFILMHKAQADPAKAIEVLKFFDWSFAHGDKMASELDYVAIPPSVVGLIKESWKANLRGPGGAMIWK
ncbi:MAG: phosphate ABC transporter substrate-binding protein PstS [Betaproteobacteria bacterium]|jgi:phosphate transport system substrate-binding protein|nr:phosphate ABC transporter substrate-binding protein PstS [Betaproteobacteria bacterium]